jgi:hypothetical protein
MTAYFAANFRGETRALTVWRRYVVEVSGAVGAVVA